MKSKRSAEPQLRTYENEQPAQVPVATSEATTLPVSFESGITEPDLRPDSRPGVPIVSAARLCGRQ